ncbi:MAG: tRNA (adenosine(37)-N6)-dimethylallyltransferase MiaA [Pirellulaceae bacterium]|nr:tRNA (adenosine(37)-N6)-dimethylallyltransferase MiaA [Pirellulaceae bacterium]
MTSHSELDNQQKIAISMDCWFITGATASGKSQVSIELARRLPAEIVSLDSMAIYRGMDIGTAKASPSMQAEIPHHMIDIVEPTDLYSVMQFRDEAISTIMDIRSRHKQVIFVGGSALYLKALLRGIFDGPPADPEFREQIERELQDVSVGELHKRLAQVDPISAQKLHPNDKRRIIRALEVYRTTGQPISHLQNEFETAHSPEDCKVFTLRHPRSVLHQRIQDRVDWMFDNGFVTEVENLLQQYGELGKTASQAVGYREVIEHVQGKNELSETRDLVLYRTRQFARHQETWFRGLAECRMLDLPENIPPAELTPWVIEHVLEQTSSR